MAPAMPRLDDRCAPRARRLPQRLLGHRRGSRRGGPLRRSALRARLARRRGRSSARRSARSRPARRRSTPRARRRAAVAICMATYDPPPALLERQLESIRAQTHRNWVCVISDDCSQPERFAALRGVVGDDPRFVRLALATRRLGFYRNFERALALAPAGARYVALADQDDRWHPDKLATLLRRARRRAARLQRRARSSTRDGARARRHATGSRRRNNHTDLLSLLVANSVTGAASLFRARRCSTTRCRSRPAQFAHFHDHWLGARARWRSATSRFVDRPLYDYVQHGDATLGHAAANRMPSLRDRLGARCAATRASAIRLWRHALLRRRLPAAAVRDGAASCAAATRMAPAKRRALERFAARRPLAAPRWRGLLRARRARARRAGARDARRRVDARPRASPGGGC